MGFKQTPVHKNGKNSFHQIGLVRGQFGGVEKEEWLAFLQGQGFDGYEEVGWELDLGQGDTNDGAETYAEKLVAQAQRHDLQIFTIAAHLQGQALGDEPSAKTLQFVGNEAARMYVMWRQAGNNPPREDPFGVPPDVGSQIHKQAQEDLIRIVRLAHYVGKLQNRVVPVSGFVGSPAGRWNHWFGFPPLPKEISCDMSVDSFGKTKKVSVSVPVPDVNKASAELLIERFRPIWNTCLQYKVPFGLECHPSEFAMGDIASAREFLAVVDMANPAYAEVVGFNLDGSHMEWQDVSVVQFIREFSDRIWSVHLKGVWVAKGYTVNGLLGGHRPMGDPENGWNFVTAGSDRDCVPESEVLVELNRWGYDGALNIEWEDNDANQLAGTKLARSRIAEMDLPPSGIRHDEALKAK